jgi:hypothetical protein
MYKDYYLLMIKENEEYIPYELYSSGKKPGKNLDDLNHSFHLLKDAEPKIVKVKFKKISLDEIEKNKKEDISVAARVFSNDNTFIEEYFSSFYRLKKFYNMYGHAETYSVIPQENKEMNIDNLIKNLI